MDIWKLRNVSYNIVHWLEALDVAESVSKRPTREIIFTDRFKEQVSRAQRWAKTFEVWGRKVESIGKWHWQKKTWNANQEWQRARSKNVEKEPRIEMYKWHNAEQYTTASSSQMNLTVRFPLSEGGVLQPILGKVICDFRYCHSVLSYQIQFRFRWVIRRKSVA